MSYVDRDYFRYPVHVIHCLFLLHITLPRFWSSFHALEPVQTSRLLPHWNLPTREIISLVWFARHRSTSCGMRQANVFTSKSQLNLNINCNWKTIMTIHWISYLTSDPNLRFAHRSSNRIPRHESFLTTMMKKYISNHAAGPQNAGRKHVAACYYIPTTSPLVNWT